MMLSNIFWYNYEGHSTDVYASYEVVRCWSRAVRERSLYKLFAQPQISVRWAVEDMWEGHEKLQ